MAFDTAIQLPSPTGASLNVRIETATEPAKAIVVICHGLAEHSARYGGFARFLAANGYHAYALDHRGHGYTTAPDAERGRFAKENGAEKVVSDVAALRDFATSTHPGLKVILFGHSMGGLIAATAAETDPHKYDALCVWNSNLNGGLAGRIGELLIKGERFFKGSDVPSALGPKLTFAAWAKSVKDAKTEFDWLSHDPAEVALYVADPLCGFDVSVSMWLDIMHMVLVSGSARGLARLPKSLPVNLVGGGQDPATSGGKDMIALERHMKAAGLNNIHLTLYPHMRHETLNEIGREEAMKALVAWADGVVAQLGKS